MKACQNEPIQIHESSLARGLVGAPISSAASPTRRAWLREGASAAKISAWSDRHVRHLFDEASAPLGGLCRRGRAQQEGDHEPLDDLALLEPIPGDPRVLERPLGGLGARAPAAREVVGLGLEAPCAGKAELVPKLLEDRDRALGDVDQLVGP